MKFDELDNSLAEVGNHLSALKMNQQLDIFESVWATTHVHIGFDAEDKEALNYRFFQHVAFILLSYEHKIAECFPRPCCGVKLPAKPEPEEPIYVDEPLETTDEMD
jgi:hypothetical protein